jgi:hypothetical protein
MNISCPEAEETELRHIQKGQTLEDTLFGVEGKPQNNQVRNK